MADNRNTGAQRSLHVSGDQAYIEYYPFIRYFVLISCDDNIIRYCFSFDIELLFYHLVRIYDMCTLALLR